MSDLIDKFGRVLHLKVAQDHKALLQQAKNEQREALKNLKKEIQILNNQINSLKRELDSHLHNNIDFEKLESIVRQERQKELFKLVKILRWYRFNPIVTTTENEEKLHSTVQNTNTSWEDLFPEYKMAVSLSKKGY